MRVGGGVPPTPSVYPYISSIKSLLTNLLISNSLISNLRSNKNGKISTPGACQKLSIAQSKDTS